MTIVSTPGPLGFAYTYDKSGNVLTASNPPGTTAYEYDARNRLVEVTEADPDSTGPLESPVWTYTYNDANQVVTMTDPRGFVTTYGYDGIGRLVLIVQPDPDGEGPQTTPMTIYQYDAASQLTKVIDAKGNATEYEYDGLGRIVRVIEADPDDEGALASPEWEYEYDAVGNLVGVTDPLGFETIYAYDGLDRLVSVTGPDPDGGGSQAAPVTSFTYDAVGNLLSVTDPLGGTTSYEYNNRYFLTEITQPAVAAGTPVWTFVNDAAGQVTEVIDPLQRSTDYTYDVLGRTTRVTGADPDGTGPAGRPETDYAYDANSNLTSVTDALENVTSWEYDRLDRLTKITRPDPGGLGTPVTTFAYDASGNLTSVTDPLSRVTSYAYDGLNRRTSVTQPDPDGGGSQTSPVTSFGYDAVGNVTSITDPRGNETTRLLDNLYRTISITGADPDGGGSQSSPVTSFTYDALGQMLSMTDPMSRLTSYEYDGLGRNVKIIEPDPDGAGALARPETTFSYDAIGNLLSVTDPLNHTTSYLYDALYRQTRITDANNGQTNFAYDKVGNLLSLTDPVGNVTSWTYDGLDRAIEETNELALTRSFQYDAVGNLTSKTDRSGRETDYVYDNLYRNTQEKWIDDDPPAPSIDVSTTTDDTTSDEVQRVGYSAMMITGGTFTLSLDGQTTGAIGYNATAATVQSALEGLSTVGAGNVAVTKITDSSTTQEWRLTFQGSLADTDVSQVTINTSGITYFGGKVDIQATDTQGGAAVNEVQVVDLNDATGGTFTLSFGGQTTSALDFDATAAEVDSALEALSSIDTVSVTGSAGGPWTITFTGSHSGQNVPELTGDASGLINRIVARTLLFTYDAADQLTGAEDPSAEYAYVYDNLGRVTQQTQVIAGLTPTIVFNQAFDAASNRTELAATIGANADFKNMYAYDNLNRMTQVIQQGNGGNGVAAKRIDLTYNASGQFDTITRYNNTAGSQEVVETFHEYDGMGRLTDLDHKKGTNFLAGYDYTYDAASRITSIDSLTDGQSEFTYDVTNQLTAADHTSQPDENYSFDLNGNRTMTGHTVGTNNRLTTDGTYNYEYDNEGNLIRKTEISSGDYEEYQWDHRNRLTDVIFRDSTDEITKTVEHSYDVFNRWIRRSVDEDGPGGAAAVDTFFSYDGSQIVLQFDGAADTDLSHRYTWGPAVDQLFADEDVSSLTSPGDVIWPLSDHLNTPRDLATYDSGTDTTTVANHREYDSFGLLISETNASVTILIGFTGRPFDTSTGLQNNWHRWYVATSGVWMSEDPIGFAGDDANLRRYGYNSPVVVTDPSGLKPPGAFPPPPRRADEELWINKKARELDIWIKGALGRLIFGDRKDWKPISKNPLTDEDREVIADTAQMALDLAGIVDPTGACDVSSAGMSALRGVASGDVGKLKEAGLNIGISAAGLLPGAGDLLKLTKVKKWLQTIKKLGGVVAKNADLAAKIRPLLKQMRSGVEHILKHLPDCISDAIRKKLEELKDAIDDLLKKTDPFRRTPKNLGEKLAMDEATAGAGQKIMDNLNDPDFKGMEKWQHVHYNPDGTKTVIHYVRDPKTGKLLDFKFKD